LIVNSSQIKMAIIKIDVDKCKGCELCTINCPRGLIKMSKELNRRGSHFAVVVKTEECTGCSQCALICPDTAIEVYR